MAGKKPAFTVEEIIIIENGVEERLDVLEDGIISSREQKIQAWNDIRDLVNEAGEQNRSVREVKRRYNKERKLFRRDYYKQSNKFCQRYQVSERKPTFSVAEIIAIEDGVEDRLDFLEDGSASTQEQKDNAWNEIRVLVNEIGANNRSVQALKRKYSEQRRLQHRDLFQSEFAGRAAI